MRRDDALNWQFSWCCVFQAEGEGQPVCNDQQLLKLGCELKLLSTSSWRADCTFGNWLNHPQGLRN